MISFYLFYKTTCRLESRYIVSRNGYTCIFPDVLCRNLYYFAWFLRIVASSDHTLSDNGNGEINNCASINIQSAGNKYVGGASTPLVI